MPTGDIISPILEAVMLMGHAHNKITSKRHSNIKSTLHKDIRTVCDVTKPGEHLFGDDWGKAVKDARQDAQVAKMLQEEVQQMKEQSTADKLSMAKNIFQINSLVIRGNTV